MSPGICVTPSYNAFQVHLVPPEWRMVFLRTFRFYDVCDAARASEDGQWKTVTLELPWSVRRIKAARSDLHATS